MADKHCEGCLSPIPDEEMACPQCGQPIEDVEIDLGSPVAALDENLSGPPSGASFLSWESLLESRLQTVARGKEKVSEDEAEIDLGAPVAEDLGKDGPPSGASLLSWDALLKSRRADLGPGGSKPTAATLPTGPTLISQPEADEEEPGAPEPPVGPRSKHMHWIGIVALGIGAGVVLLFVFSLLG